MMLEAAQHSDNAFATLTYSEENLPHDLSVRPAEISGFIKRLRARGVRVRYFAAGEYGDDSFRPHYHAALFGLPTCDWGTTRKKDSCCPQCTLIHETWGLGQIMLGTLSPESMAYVAGYINKKMTREFDPRLEGRRPEFARMSLRPGIGAGMMHDLASTLMEHGLDRKLVDVPAFLRHGTVMWPLGRYLRRKLRVYIGRDINAPLEAIQEQKASLHPLRQAAFDASIPFKTAILETTLGRRIQIEARHKLRKKARPL